MCAKPRRSSAKLPITKKANVNTAESKGEEKDEKNNATAVMIANCNTMKYSATTTPRSLPCRWPETYSSEAKTPAAMQRVFTTNVPVRPKNFPAMNSQRLTGRDKTV